MSRFRFILLCLLPFGLQAQIPTDDWQNLLDHWREHKLLHEIQVGIERSAKQDRPLWFYWQGKAYLQLEEWEQAQQSFHQALVRAPHSILNLAGIYQSLIAQGLESQAQNYLNQLVKNEARLKSEEEMLAMARAYWISVELRQEAKVLWYHAMERFPRSYRPHWELASIYLRQQQYELAGDQFFALLEVKADYAPAILGLAQIAIARNQLKVAANFINQTLKLDPDLAEAYRYRGELYLRIDQFAKAQADYQTYLYYTGGDARSWVYYAGALYLAGYYYNCLQALDQFVPANTSLRTIRSRLKAFAWADLGRWDSAQYWLETFQHQAPAYQRIPADKAYWGAYLIRNGNVEGEELLVAAVAERSSLRHHYQELAHWWIKREDYAEASRFAERYLASYAIAASEDWLWLAKIQYFAGLFEAAHASVRRSLDQQSPTAEQYYWWGSCARKLQLRDEMTLAFSQLIDLLADVEAQSSQEHDYFLQACTVLALYYYHDGPYEGQDCETAMLYAELAVAKGGEKEKFEYILSACK
ncbi:MAG: hypothetical protein AAF927_24810 [Bacteroidota bacterium]